MTAPPTSPDTSAAAHSAYAEALALEGAPFVLLDRSVPEFAVDPVTVAETAPTVADGAAPVLPFIASASAESVAKPTEAGLERNTEYTFLRKVSPTIHGGALVPAVLSAKNAPTQLSDESCCRRKSALLIGHAISLEPKRIVTFTFVLQAAKTEQG